MAGAAAGDLVFMTGAVMPIADISAVITRAGYTGEDGLKSPSPALTPRAWPRYC